MIVLLTDFGMDDVYVGVMKGVIAGIAPQCSVVDLTHGIRPQDVAEAAYRLDAGYPYFPSGTIFCCVVDPGVGSERRAVVVQAGSCVFVAPDNGLLTPVLHREKFGLAVQLDRPEFFLPAVSFTFHGRDVFAPVAARIAAGMAPEELGSIVDIADLVLLPDMEPVAVPGGWRARVMTTDRFGNLLTNCPAALAQQARRICVGDVCVERLHRTFSDVPAGAPVAYIGSGGMLELAVNGGNAARDWQVATGAEVLIDAPA